MKKLVRDNILKIEHYRPGKPTEELRRELGIEGEIIKLASNENPLGPSSLALKAIEKTLGEANLYPDDSCHYLTGKLAKHLGVSSKNLTLGSGTTELICLIATALLNREDSLIMSKPSFIMGKLAALLMDCRLVEVPLKDFRHDLPAILDRIDDNTKVVYIDNPINPIGTMTTAGEVSEFMDQVPDSVVVVFDEAYYEYVERDDYPETVEFVRDERNVMVLRSFSKIYGLAGLRVGYCIAKDDLTDALERTRPPFNVNRLGQAAALAALEDVEHVKKTREVTDKGRRLLISFFDRMSIPCVPSFTNFVTIDVKKHANVMFEELQKEGIIVRPLAGYDEPTLLRVTIGTEEQNKRFTEAFEKVWGMVG